MRRFWNWQNHSEQTTNGEGEAVGRVLVFNGEIAPESWFDDDITPQIFAQELNAESGPVTIWINSPGGDVVAAAQIYNMITTYPGHVTVNVDGIAASAASVIAMAADRLCMSPVSMLMIHNPATLAIGDAKELGRAIDMLEAVKESIINAYELKTGLPRARIASMMDAETWMDARAAIELGFADAMITKRTNPLHNPDDPDDDPDDDEDDPNEDDGDDGDDGDDDEGAAYRRHRNMAGVVFSRLKTLPHPPPTKNNTPPVVTGEVDARGRRLVDLYSTLYAPPFCD